MTKTTKTAAVKPTKADLIAEILGYGKHSRTALTRMTLAALQALAADLGCGGCDNDEHCGGCECCDAAKPKRAAERLTIGGVTVRVGRVAYWLTIGDREVGYFRREDLETVVAMREEDTKVGRTLTTFPALKNAALRTADLDAIRPVLAAL